MNNEKKILYIATSNMFLRTGGGIANSALYKSLCKNYGGRIDVLHYRECLPENVREGFIPVPPVDLLKKVLLLIRGKIHRFYPWLDDFLREHAGEYSHCIINTGLLGDYVSILKGYGIKVAVVHHNFEVEFQKDNRMPSTFWGMSDFLVRKQESMSYINADYNIFLTPDDQQLFHLNYPKTVKENEYVVGIFDNASFDGSSIPLKGMDSKKLCICGSLNSFQTIHGIENFREKYLKTLIEFYDDNFSLIIAGRNPGKQVKDLSEENSNIQIVANPVKMSDVIYDCGIFICPTDIGGGIKLRIMDGLKMGMPILTHKISARGYNMFFNYPWFQIYEDEASFHKGLCRIVDFLESEVNARKQIQEAYYENFSLEEGDEKFREAMKSFIENYNIQSI